MYHFSLAIVFFNAYSSSVHPQKGGTMTWGFKHVKEEWISSHFLVSCTRTAKRSRRNRRRLLTTLWTTKKHTSAMTFFHRRTWQTFLLSIWVLLDSSHGSLLAQPTVQWTHRLTGSGDLSARGLRKDNAVVVSKGGNFLFVTADDGSLHILDPQKIKDDTISIVFEPTPVEGRSTGCRSGVTPVEDEGGRTQYLVYAVIDTPVVSGLNIGNDGTVNANSNSNVKASSRLLAVDLDGKLLWSVPLDGIIAGTPLVGQNGTSIYVSHNVAGETDDALDSRQGYLSVLRAKEPLTSPEITASYSRGAPFGPLSLVRVLLGGGGGRETGGQSADMVAVAESWDFGYRQDGSVYLLLPSTSYEELQGRGDEAYDLRLASSWPYSSVSRPTLGPSGQSMWMNGYASTVSGWTNNQNLADVISGLTEDTSPQWTGTFQTTERNVSQGELLL
jgi:hypothetical protein